MKKSIPPARRALFGLIVLLLTIGVCSNLYSQPVTQKARLHELSQLYSQQLQARRTQMYYDLLKSDQLPQRRLNENPDIQLMYIDQRGQPVFYMVENRNAARTISTDDVWPGGSGGFSLSGSATVMGELAVWDAGGVRTAHQELTGRVTQMDSPGATHYHSTHVAGTMIAAGVQVTAKGMSFQGTLAAYDWYSDNAEMASAAASGMNVSNHSYGFITGWRYDGDWYWWGDITISTTEDYGFGFYGSNAQDWDQIAYNAPFYTIVKSAGNDRNDNGPGAGGGHYVWDGGWVWSTDTRDKDGGTDGYDCIPWYANAKNIITMGAVNDITGGYTSPSGVVMSSFSGWGPADDGRIKPDLVANGVSLYSCLDDNNTDYGSLSGTSMSSPNLSGSLNLLVRHYEATHEDSTPLSSTMKAVLIHTADEAGPDPGPDYMFGWGLMNTLSAARLIQQDSVEQGLIIEESLSNGESHEYLMYYNGTGPMRITLAWTDPPGTPPTPSLNPTTPMLVNDLDLRLEHVGTSTIYQPYILDPANPANAADTGDNTRDNVEQVHVADPPPGRYQVTVSHKGVLSPAQYYSVVVGDTTSPAHKLIESSRFKIEMDNQGKVGAVVDWEHGVGDTIHAGNGGSLILGTDPDNLALTYSSSGNPFSPGAEWTQDSLYFTWTDADGPVVVYLFERHHTRFQHPVLPLEIELFAIGAFDPEGGPCEDAVFLKYVIHNAGAEPIDSIEKALYLDLNVEPNDTSNVVDGVEEFSTIWAFEATRPNILFGMTQKPVYEGGGACGGFGVSQPHYIYPQSGWDMDTLKDIMDENPWDMNRIGDQPTDVGIMLIDQPFSLEPGAYYCNEYIVWAYDKADPVDSLTFGKFLYQLMKQEGYYRGDANCDGLCNIADVVYLVLYAFRGGDGPLPFDDQGDANCDGVVTIADAVYLINYLFREGPSPVDKNRFFDEPYKTMFSRPGLVSDSVWTNLPDLVAP